MSGIVGAMMRHRLVTSDQLQAFLSEMPPRSIPGNIKRRRMGSGSLVAALGGALFFLAGSCLAVYSVVYAQGPWNADRIVPLVFGIIFPLIGLPVCILTVRYRHVNKRLVSRHPVGMPVVMTSFSASSSRRRCDSGVSP